MSVRFVPLDALGAFPPGRLAAIVGWLEAAAREVGPPLGAERVDVMVVPDARPVPGWDINGYSHGPARITLGVDPGCLGREKRPLPEQLRSTLAHELHHAMRSRGPGYGRTLGEALVSEGLAQCYEVEAGCPVPNYAVAVRGEPLRRLAARADGERGSDRYVHWDWFYGSRTDPSFPWSGGYSLGYALVRRYLEEAGLTASRGVAVPAEEVFAALPSLPQLVRIEDDARADGRPERVGP